jgi:hypothetical protein
MVSGGTICIAPSRLGQSRVTLATPGHCRVFEDAAAQAKAMLS